MLLKISNSNYHINFTIRRLPMIVLFVFEAFLRLKKTVVQQHCLEAFDPIECVIQRKKN